MSASVLVQTSMHIGDLDAASTSLPGGRWRAQVTQPGEDSANHAIPGATVRGTFTQRGWSLAISCLTDPTGACTVDSGVFPSTSANASSTVQAPTLPGSSYVPSRSTTRTATAPAHHPPRQIEGT